MKYKDIGKSCFEVATHLMWEKDTLTVDRIESNLAELNIITEKLYKISEDQFESRKSLGINPGIVSRAIHYINRVHTIPPLRGNYEWFENTLEVLLEIVCPNTLMKKESEHLNFLKDIEKGIIQSRNDSIDE